MNSHQYREKQSKIVPTLSWLPAQTRIRPMACHKHPVHAPHRRLRAVEGERERHRESSARQAANKCRSGEMERWDDVISEAEERVCQIATTSASEQRAVMILVRWKNKRQTKAGCAQACLSHTTKQPLDRPVLSAASVGCAITYIRTAFYDWQLRHAANSWAHLPILYRVSRMIFSKLLGAETNVLAINLVFIRTKRWPCAP